MALASTSELVDASTEPAHRSTTTSMKGMIIISGEFFHSLVDIQRVIANWLKVIETKMTTLFRQMSQELGAYLSRIRLDGRLTREPHY